MATGRVLISAEVLLLFTVLLAAICLGDEAQSVTEECRKRCERTYPPHTYPKKEPLEACFRGCRLSAISQLLSRNRIKVNASQTCMKGCGESYTDKDSNYACRIGCQEQKIIPTAEAMYIKDHEKLLGVWSLRGYTNIQPIMVAHQYCHGLLRRVTYYMSTSTSYYFGNSRGQAVVIRIQEPPEFFASASEAKQAPLDEPEVKVEKREQGHSGYTWRVVHKGKMWLHCVSRRSGLPFWLVVATLFLALVFLLWLCGATISTASHKEKEKHLCVDDLMLLNDAKLSEKILLTRSEEAGPIPVKVHISTSVI